MTLAFWLLGLSALSSQDGSAEIRVTKALADGREIPLAAQSETATEEKRVPLKFASTTKSLAFHFEGAPEAGENIRLKYKLDGHDLGWHELKSEMVVWLRMRDQTGSVIAGDVLALQGESPGWNGHAEDAPLAPCKLELTAPRQADRMMVFFISGGDQKNLGQLVAQDITLSVNRSSGGPSETFELDCETGTGNGNPLDIPIKWRREGERPDIAKVLRRATPDRKMALFLDDADPQKFGVWCSRDVNTTLTQGDRVTLQWNAAYSIGQGHAGAATYSNLKPGNYWFRIASVYPNGIPTGHEVTLPVVVVPPLYQRTDFWLAMAVAFCGLLLLAVRLVLWRRMQRRLAQSEHLRMLEAERSRIARDIHDDLGATLAQIAMLSELAEADEQQSRPVGTLLHDIFTRAHDTTRKLDEIVWALKPANDTLDHLIGYLCQFAESHMKLAGLSFRLEAPDTLPPCALTSGQRHNLFLAAKEAFHNVVKHANATEVWLRVGVTDNVLHLRIEDNGSGRVPGPDVPLSRGSANMKSRLEQLGGSYTRTGSAGKGTLVELTLPLKGQTL
jgi:signal transduction histidine kinase